MCQVGQAGDADMQRDLRCIGVTCVEHKLQDDAPDTIQYLLRAKIHVWMLTGDKLETAINIVHSSSIIVKADMTTPPCVVAAHVLNRLSRH